MKEDKNIFLKVDSVEPVYKDSYAPIEGIRVWIGAYGYFFPCDRYTVCDPDIVREDGRRQALDLVKNIYDMAYDDRKKAFGKAMPNDLFANASYEELAKLLDDWKKEKEKIRVRDEVYSEAYEMRFVVTKIWVPSGGKDAYANGLKKDGTAVKGLLLCNLKKTGLHVDDLDSYLEV